MGSEARDDQSGGGIEQMGGGQSCCCEDGDQEKDTPGIKKRYGGGYAAKELGSLALRRLNKRVESEISVD